MEKSGRLKLLATQVDCYLDMHEHLSLNLDSLTELMDKWDGKKINKRFTNKVKEILQNKDFNVYVKNGNWVYLAYINNWDDKAQAYIPNYTKSLFSLGEKVFDAKRALIGLRQNLEYINDQQLKIKHFLKYHEDVFAVIENIKNSYNYLIEQTACDDKYLFKYEFTIHH